MENFVKRFPGVSEQIFNKLEDQSLAACNEASREWNNFLTEERFWWIRIIQVNFCQKLLFLHQLTHNMTTDCSLFMKIVNSEYLQNMLCTQNVFLVLF